MMLSSQSALLFFSRFIDVSTFDSSIDDGLMVEVVVVVI